MTNYSQAMRSDVGSQESIRRRGTENVKLNVALNQIAPDLGEIISITDDSSEFNSSMQGNEINLFNDATKNIPLR